MVPWSKWRAWVKENAPIPAEAFSAEENPQIAPPFILSLVPTVAEDLGRMDFSDILDARAAKHVKNITRKLQDKCRAWLAVYDKSSFKQAEEALRYLENISSMGTSKLMQARMLCLTCRLAVTDLYRQDATAETPEKREILERIIDHLSTLATVFNNAGEANSQEIREHLTRKEETNG